MIAVQQAEQIILATAKRLPVEAHPLVESTGMILQEPLIADRDFPPFDRVMMDGIAIRHADWLNGQRVFRVQGTQYAGAPPMTLEAGTVCLEVMTGAVLPEGADTVIRYEDIEIREGENSAEAHLADVVIHAGQNVHPKGKDQLAGTALAPSGIKISPAEIALAATIGKSMIEVSRPPRVLIVSTGDELVEVAEQPLPHQIRMSNSYMLEASLREMGIEATRLHVPDERMEIHLALEPYLQSMDAWILSGGVSKGKADYLPEVLSKLGIRQKFHRVAQRPGKPFWFGVHPEGPVVFALPGNPVSTFMGYYRYVRPWIRKSLGMAPVFPIPASLTDDFRFRPSLTHFLQVKAFVDAQGAWQASPIPGKGSGDLANLLLANGFLELPADRSDFGAGEIFPLWLFR
ncbi:molybdopterin molybdotransferase MoeA [Pontibacter sp. G13]|uniref:molybdopterin molybdotransferase MoeA n=1 Tax=Pontibacter sp. G13 TaxID=3074898 RepID=UPI00288B3CBE|nr:molybdopterin molybdotransferase MoeA [Pontibacter sp. G13]WNJ17183.1 molybdopterin molybdotransferase MoeA [Pontibacter sp. G13]